MGSSICPDVVVEEWRPAEWYPARGARIQLQPGGQVRQPGRTDAPQLEVAGRKVDCGLVEGVARGHPRREPRELADPPGGNRRSKRWDLEQERWAGTCYFWSQLRRRCPTPREPAIAAPACRHRCTSVPAVWRTSADHPPGASGQEARPLLRNARGRFEGRSSDVVVLCSCTRGEPTTRRVIWLFCRLCGWGGACGLPGRTAGVPGPGSSSLRSCCSWWLGSAVVGWCTEERVVVGSCCFLPACTTQRGSGCEDYYPLFGTPGHQET